MDPFTPATWGSFFFLKELKGGEGAYVMAGQCFAESETSPTELGHLAQYVTAVYDVSRTRGPVDV